MKKPPTSSSSGLNSKQLYTKALRPLDYNWSGCSFHEPSDESARCKLPSERSWWVSTGDGLVDHEQPPLGAKHMCLTCMREMGLLW